MAAFASSCRLPSAVVHVAEGAARPRTARQTCAISTASFKDLRAAAVLFTAATTGDGWLTTRPVSARQQSTAGASKVNAVSGSRTVAEGQQSSAEELVDQLLAVIKDTDRGASADDATRAKATELILGLEKLGLPEPLKSPLIFGDWEVAYTSSPTAAGGYYRAALGRALLKTEDMVQAISQPNGVGNRVVFKAFGALPGRVSLDGRFAPLDNQTVKVTFDAPQLELGPWQFTYGGTSSVRLATIYLDERVRIGRGSRGSLFVFVRR